MKLSTGAIKSIFICLVFLMSSIFISIPGFFTSPAYGSLAPPASGDWIITGTESYANAEFIVNGGVIDVGVYIDSETKAIIGGDVSNGEELYEETCSFCHGDDGLGQSEALGELANGNPWETLHKIRFGQPGVGMPAAVDNNRIIQETTP